MPHRSLRALLLAAVALSRASNVFAAGEMKTLVGAFADPKLGGPCVAVRDGKLAHADLEIALGTGVACPVLAGEAKIGWFYSGTASFRYLSRDRIEYPVLRFNAKSEGRVEVKDVDGGSLAVTGSARTVFFAASSGALPALAGADTEAPVSAFQKHRTAFARYGGLSTPHLFAAAALDRWTTPAVRVELGEGDGPLLYTFEPTDERSESLEILGEYVTSDREVRRELRSTILSEQPIARDRRVPVPAPFSVTAVDYELTASGGDSVAIQARTTIVPARDGIRVLRFELPGRILTSSGPGESSERTYRVASVTDGKGGPLDFDQARGYVIVDLARSLAKGEAPDVVFHVEGNYLVRPNGDNYWILEGAEIFPQPERSGAQYTSHGLIRVKKPFRAFASGTTVRRAEDGEDNVVEVRSDLPTDLLAVVAGKYSSSEETRDGLTVRVSTYAAKNPRSQTQLTELAFGMIRHFERFLGPFPNSEFNIVQVNDLGWGQAPLGVMLITNEAFDLLLPEDLKQIYTEGINERFAHEIAHQWWGHAVRVPNPNERWLSESFAEYCAGLMVKRAQGKGRLDNLKASWKVRGKEASHVAPIALADRITFRDIPTYESYRVGLLYAKGPWLLSRLNDEIGDEKFLTFLKSYQKTLRGKCGSTTLAIELLRVLTGKDYGPFFEANFWGTGMPN
jgi:hypothetical protein